jgi:hypothetical protein
MFLILATQECKKLLIAPSGALSKIVYDKDAPETLTVVHLQEFRKTKPVINNAPSFRFSSEFPEYVLTIMLSRS